MKFFKFFLPPVVALILLLLSAVWAVNSIDMPLDPQIPPILAERPPYSDTQIKAYEYLLGLHAADLQTPEETGHKLWQEFKTLKPEQQAEFWKTKVTRLDPWATNFHGCKPLCTVAALEQKPDLAATLEEFPAAFQNYIKLMHFGAGAAILEGNAQVPFPGIWTISLRMQQKMQLQMAVWLKDGQTAKALSLLEQSDNYLRSIAANGNLFDSLVAVTALRWNADFLKAELERKPKTHLSKTLADSFVTPDANAILLGAMKHELRTLNALSENILQGSDNKFAPEGEAQLRPFVRRFLPVKHLFRPHETLNKFFTTNSEALALDCGVKQDNPCPQDPWLTASWTWRTIENPVGRQLLQLTDMAIPRRRKKLEENLKVIAGLRQEILARH